MLANSAAIMCCTSKNNTIPIPMNIGKNLSPFNADPEDIADIISAANPVITTIAIIEKSL